MLTGWAFTSISINQKHERYLCDCGVGDQQNVEPFLAGGIGRVGKVT